MYIDLAAIAFAAHFTKGKKSAGKNDNPHNYTEQVAGRYEFCGLASKTASEALFW